MPLGALTALSLSTAVIQFIDFAVKLTSKGYKLYNAAEGSLLEYSELDTSARKIIQLSNVVTQTYDNALQEDSYRSGGSIPFDSEAQLKDICRSCNATAEKLVIALERLKSPEKRSKWKSFRQAFKSLWGKARVDALKNDLDVQRNALNTTLLVSLKYNLHDVKKVLQSRDTDFTWQKKLVEDVDRHQLRDDKAGDIAQFGNHLSQATLNDANRQLEAQLLRQLDFQDRSDRGDRIPKAHQDTFQWIYASQSGLERTNLKFSSFADWLENDDNLYWITGKPGSGKSTLMKFIITDSRTRKHLRVWSRKQPLVVASYYFWNSGSRSQMTEAGMLRTILYEALSQWSERTRELFPRRWAASKLIGADTSPWTVAELRSALDIFVKRCAGYRKLCLFVDGLDECSEEHQELVGFFTKYLSLKSVKCCLASRPWPVFEDAFCQRASLMLQELTFNDIFRYAKDKLCSSRGFAMLEASEPRYASRIVFRIAKKASGVYLWVCLVVNSLLRGLSNCDRISDLEKRLEETPGDLEELYEKMLRNIEKFYAGHASQLFQLVRESQGNITALTLSFADEEDGNAAFDAKLQPLSDEAKMMKYEIVKKRLTSRCKGFLEIPKDIDMTIDESLGKSMRFEDETLVMSEESHTSHFSRPKEKANPADFKIAYLHRTARDFLERPDIWSSIIAESPKGFDVQRTLMRALVLSLKTSQPSEPVAIGNCITWCLQYTVTIERRYQFVPLKEMEEIMSAVVDLCKRSASQSAGHIETEMVTQISKHGEPAFLLIAAQYNLQSFIQNKLENGVLILPGQATRPLLDCVIGNYPDFPSLCERSKAGEDRVLNLTFIRRLLDLGNKPNESVNGKTPWERVLFETRRIACDEASTEKRKRVLLHWAKIIDEFIKHDADPYAIRSGANANVIREAFGPDLPEIARALEMTLSKSQRAWGRLGKFLTKSTDSSDSKKVTPLFRQIQLENAQMSGLSSWEHFMHSIPDVKSNSSGLLGTLKKFEPSR